MDQVQTGIVMLCVICIVPFIAGVGVTLTVQKRVNRLGWWGLLPLGGIIKHYWDTRPE